MIRIPASPRLPLGAALVACLLGGCRSAPEEELTADTELIELLSQGDSIEPAEDFDADAYLEELTAEYAVGEEGLPWLEAAEQEDELSPWQEFGTRIQVYRDSGFVMKPYYFPVGVGAKVKELLRTYSGIPVHAHFDGLELAQIQRPEGPQPLDSVVLHLVPGFDKEAFSSPRSQAVDRPQSIPLSDMLVVTAMPAELRRVEHFIETFVADVRQIEIEAKIVEVGTRRTLDYGIRPIDRTTPIFGLPNPGTLVNSIDFSFGNTVDSPEAVFKVASVFDGVEFNALLDLVATSERVSIISRPKVAVREGARAEIRNTTRIPFFNLSAINANGNFTSTLSFQDVGVQMYVIPRIIGRDTIILNIDVEASQRTGTAVALTQGDGDNLSVVTLPEISRRKATTTVRLRPGQAVILGGLITERTLEREKKIPLLGDIPLLGNLFKSTLRQTQEVNVLFFIRPRILQGIDLDPEGF